MEKITFLQKCSKEQIKSKFQREYEIIKND